MWITIWGQGHAFRNNIMGGTTRISWSQVSFQTLTPPSLLLDLKLEKNIDAKIFKSSISKLCKYYIHKSTSFLGITNN